MKTQGVMIFEGHLVRIRRVPETQLEGRDLASAARARIVELPDSDAAGRVSLRVGGARGG